MQKEGYLQIIEELELQDCFKDAKIPLEVSQKAIDDLKNRIDEEILENHREYERGIALLKLDENYYYGNIDQKVFKKVRKDLLPK